MLMGFIDYNEPRQYNVDGVKNTEKKTTLSLGFDWLPNWLL